MIEAVSRAVVATDPSGIILSRNRAAQVLDGWSADEVLGRNVVDALVPEASVAAVDEILEQVRGGTEWSGAATLATLIEQAARDSFADSSHDDMAVLVLRVPA